MFEMEELCPDLQTVFSKEILKADSEVVSFPASRILEHLKEKTQIPILIPSEVPNFEPLVNIILLSLSY